MNLRAIKTILLASLTAVLVIAVGVSVRQTAEPFTVRTLPIDLALIEQPRQRAVLSAFDEKSTTQNSKSTVLDETMSSDLTLTIVDAAAPTAQALPHTHQTEHRSNSTLASAAVEKTVAIVQSPQSEQTVTPVKKAPEPAMPDYSLSQANAAANSELSVSDEPSSQGHSLPRITGFLEPDGFQRSDWQKVHDTLLLDDNTESHSTFVVMLDPGHGGSDPGAIAHNGLLEKQLTLDVARRVKLFLSEYKDLEVILTRDKDYGLTRTSRISAIRDSDADLVVSLHFNHLPEPRLNVVETFFASPANVAESRAGLTYKAMMSRKANLRHALTPSGVDISFTRDSERLANALQRRVFAEVSFNNDEVRDAGTKAATFYVLTQSYKPAALIEITCLSNISEAQKLTTERYRNRLSNALAEGIRTYVDSLRDPPLYPVTDIGV